MRKNYALDMTCGPFFKKILIFSVPLMLTGLLQLAYNTADVVVVGDRAEPLVLAECKAPEIRIGERTLAQAVRYNSVLGARFVILTNGLRHYCCEYRDGKYVQLSGFPDFSAL